MIRGHLRKVFMIINRYFLKSIFSYTLTISLIFILIIVSSRSIQYLEQAARGEINPEIVFLVVLLRFPEFLELILPLSFFLSIILSLGKYRADSEFVIMEQLGFSLGRVYFSLLFPVLIISSFVFYSSSTLTPKLDSKVENLLRAESMQDKYNSLQPGEFHRLGQTTVLLAESRNKDVLGNVFIKISDDESERIIKALSARLIGENKNELHLERGEIYFLQDTESILSLTFDEFTLKDLDLEDFRNYEVNLDNNSLSLWPLSLITMIVISVLISLPLSKISARQGRFSRVLPALLIFAVYTGMILSFKDSHLENLRYVIATHSVFLFFGLFMNFYVFRKV